MMGRAQTPGRTGASTARGSAARYGLFFLATLLTAAVLLSAFEYIEWRWLSGISHQYLRILHLVRGMMCAMAAVTVVLYLIDRAMPEFEVGTSPEDWLDPARLTAQRRVEDHARWFILMRWIAVVVAASLAWFAVGPGDVLPDQVAPPLAWTIAALGLCNLFYSWLVSRRMWMRLLLPIQIYADLLLLTILLHFSGGIENLLSLVMIFHVIIGGIILSRVHCYCVAAVASILFAALAWAEWTHLLEHYTLLIFPHFHAEEHERHAAHVTAYVVSSVSLQCAILFLTAYFVSTLAERVRQNEQGLAGMARRAHAERQLLERALETTRTGLRVLDRGLAPFWCNLLWRRWFPAESPADPAAAKTLEDREVRVVERLVSLPENGPGSAQRQRVVQLTIAPLTGKDATEDQVVELAQDVTDAREAQAQIVRAGKLAAVGELAGQVAHEVNNPIAIISAKARLLLADHRVGMSEKVGSELEKIVRLSDRVADVAKRLLAYGRPAPRKRAALDLHVAVRRALDVVEHRALAAGVHVQDRLPVHLPPVLADANEMEQVFLNLFLNALDAMPRGGWLKITSRHSADSIEVSVQDSGEGIAPEIQARIFEPFFSTKEEGHGTGLGLAICAGLIRNHDGDIEVKSEPGQGSTFTVKLPLQQLVPQAG